MKHTLIPFCLTLMLMQASPSRKMNDREHEGFKGPVRKVFVEWSPQTDGGNAPISARCPEETQNYDQQGRLISVLLYPGICGGDGEIRENYSYDKNGNRLGWHDNSKASGIPISSPNPPTPYDRKNQDGSYSTKRVLKYESKGRISEESVYSPSGELIDKTRYKYDSQNRLIEWESIDPDGSVSEKQTFIYNGDERFPSGSIGIGSDGKPDSRETYSDYEVNSRGDWIKRRETVEHLDQPNRAKTIRIITRTIDYY
jgi:hypothetical protein